MASIHALPASGAVTDTFQELMAEFDAEDADQRKAARDKWQDLCFGLGSPAAASADRKLACETMMAALEEPLPRDVAQFLLLQVERIGHEECVAGLADLLAVEDSVVADAARRALMNNPSHAALAVLDDALHSNPAGPDRIRTIHALGYRAHPESVAALGPLLATAGGAELAAAATALAKIGTESAAQALLQAWQDADAERDAKLASSLLAIADRWQQQGDTALAHELFSQIRTKSQHPTLRGAALRGMLVAGGAATVSPQQLVEGLRDGPDADRQAILGIVEKLSQEAVQALIQAEATLPAAARVRLFSALADRREALATGALLQASASAGDAPLRIAALSALGEVADSQVVPQLLPLLQDPDGNVAAAAQRCLVQIRDQAVAQALVAAMADPANPEQRAQLLTILSGRRAAELVPLAVSDLKDADPATRQRARGYLARLGGRAELTPLMAAAHRASEEEHDQLVNVIVSICRRIPDAEAQAEPIVQMYATAASSARPAILDIVGKIGGPSAARFITAQLNSDDAEIHRAAVTALANWPDASVAGTLLTLVHSEQDGGPRNRALRGLARVVVLPSSHFTDEEQLALLQQALQLANRTNERRFVLDRAKAIDLIATARFVRPYLDDAELADVAGATLVHLARSKQLRQQYPELRDDLQKVIATTDDEKTAARAKAYLDEE